MNPSPTTLHEPALWATYEFLKEHTIKIHFSGDSCKKQYIPMCHMFYHLVNNMLKMKIEIDRFSTHI